MDQSSTETISLVKKTDSCDWLVRWIRDTSRYALYENTLLEGSFREDSGEVARPPGCPRLEVDKSQTLDSVPKMYLITCTARCQARRLPKRQSSGDKR
jgi:hypothetical protein